MTRTTRGGTAASRNWTSKYNSFFPPFSFLLTSASLDRVGDQPPEDSPPVKGKTSKHKVDKKAAKALHERVIVRPNPPDSDPFLDFYAVFHSSFTRQRVTGSDETSVDGATADTHTPEPSMDTCKATTSDRLTHLHAPQQRTLKTHITLHPNHSQGGEGSPSGVSSSPAKRSSLLQLRLSYRPMKVP